VTLYTAKEALNPDSERILRRTSAPKNAQLEGPNTLISGLSSYMLKTTAVVFVFGSCLFGKPKESLDTS